MANVYGPDERARKHTGYNVVNQFARIALAGGTLRIFGDGAQLRDYVYVRDVVEAVLRVAQTQKTAGQVYNLGSGHPIHFVDMAQMIIACAGRGQIVHQEWPSAAQTVETGDFYLSIARLRQAINWQPCYTLEHGVAETLDVLRHAGHREESGA